MFKKVKRASQSSSVAEKKLTKNKKPSSTKRVTTVAKKTQNRRASFKKGHKSSLFSEQPTLDSTMAKLAPLSSSPAVFSTSKQPDDGEYDLVVIGGGPGGYVGAIKGAQLGLKVACVEFRGSLGGTCLNVGCIPSKALLHATHNYELAQKHFKTMGIEGGELTKMNHESMMKAKDVIVHGLTKGVEHLFKKNKVTYVKGKGKITDKNTVDVILNDNGGSQSLKTKNILIATGSEPLILPGIEIDEERIITSTGALSIKEVPKRMISIGSGVIGLELSSVMSRLGSEVTVIGNLPYIGTGIDLEIANGLQKSLIKQGLKFQLGINVKKVVRKGEEVEVTIDNKGIEEVLVADVCLVAVGRKAYMDGLGLKEMGIKFNRSIEINDHWQTNIPNIYAIGDVSGKKPMLAHLAEDEGIAVVNNLANGYGHVDYNAIASVIYTTPELATVGRGEEELKAEGIEYKVGKFPFLGNSRAITNHEKEGHVKIMACAKTDKILGVHLFGPTAGELINELAVALQFGASSEDIANVCHPHPGFGEAIGEAAKHAAYGKAIHF